MATVTESARRLNVSPGTVRNYGRQFSTHLSAGANPEPGEVRQFTDDDLRIMATARDMLRGGMTYNQVLERLASGVHLVDVMPTELSAPAEPTTALATRDMLDVLTQRHDRELARILAERDAAQGRVAELERQVGELTGRLAVVTKPWWKRLLGR